MVVGYYIIPFPLFSLLLPPLSLSLSLVLKTLGSVVVAVLGGFALSGSAGNCWLCCSPSEAQQLQLPPYHLPLPPSSSPSPSLGLSTALLSLSISTTLPQPRILGEERRFWNSSSLSTCGKKRVLDVETVDGGAVHVPEIMERRREKCQSAILIGLAKRGTMTTLHLKDPRAAYADSSMTGNMLYSNYSSSSAYSDNMAYDCETPHHAVELPVPTTMLQQESTVGGSDFVSSRIGDNPFNAWRIGRNDMFMQSVGGPAATTDDLVHGSVASDPQMGLRTQLGILNGQNMSLQPPNVSGIQGQGLSLSLSTQIPVSSFNYRPSSEIPFVGSHQSPTGNRIPNGSDNSRDKRIIEPSPYGLSNLAITITNSKYLKAAQQLLDEVVNVHRALKQKSDKSHSSFGTAGRKEYDGGSNSDEVNENPQESTANSTPELSPTERQELQNKMSKLLAMLDEVDRRYKQYYHQMQIVVSSFDVIAGTGAAKPYTALALQTISQHFRCLRDAINGQIRATGKSLGELDSPSAKGSGMSRLRYIDQQIRQQKAFQQFGMMQQHAWRPQRGLPENSVSILRAWLFEHFLHPYPKDSDKLMLARQTGLTRSQVSNWFINARVRLWKPMIEEMYKEEFGDIEMDSNSSENAAKGKDESRSSEDRGDLPSLKSASERCQSSQMNSSSKSVLINNMEMDSVTTAFQNEVNAGETNYMNLKLGGQQHPAEGCSLLQDAIVQSDGSSRYMAYQMTELGRYANGGVSLTLGLQHCDGGLPVPDVPQSLVAVRGSDVYNPATLGTETADYDCLNLVDRQHRFSSLHLLHDFDDQGNNLQVLNWGQGQKLSLTLGCPVSSSMLEPSQRSSLKEQHLSCVHPDYVVARRDLMKASLNGYIVGDASGDRRYPSDDAISKAHALDLVPSSSNNMSCVNNGLRNSKYLRPTQQLLDEFVHVSKAAGGGSDGLFKNDRFTGAAPKIGSWSLQLEHSKFDEKDVICYNQCSSEEKSVSNVRIRRLFALLDELDTRYERYCRQIDEVVSSFEVVAGIEAANSYTDVAIQAMSRHFFSLRNAIVAQIRECREPSLENLSRKKSVSVSRPILPDQKSRQIRALQNLAMIQVQQVWRPLRGLPETSVALLRAWLFEHFLHPYPNDNEKQMLASKTGLTRNQISNWFINARVRLWKPMIEEMYREEFAETSDVRTSLMGVTVGVDVSTTEK
ncbi:hypothetical protein Taro_023110, partial [Colocasia esculenta]|nr:hypothetical protein [Colocasia esculenta]